MRSENKKVRVQTGNIHVYFRGNSRHNVFYDDTERIEFLKRCNQSAKKHNTVITQFVLMDNHVHLQVITDNLTTFMKGLLQSYVQWYNRKNGISDQLFKRPFNSVCKFTHEWIIDSELYILQNPIKAEICKHPSEYKWSSYFFHFGQRNPLNKYISVETDFIERYFKTKDNFDRAILERVIAISPTNERNSENFKRISDSDLVKYLNTILLGENIFNISTEKLKTIIFRLYKETNASFRQISSLTHENYDYVRKICSGL